MATLHSLNVALGMSVGGLVAGAAQARSVIKSLATDIRASGGGAGAGRSSPLGDMRERLDGVVKSTQNAESAARRLGGEWKRMGSDQTLWRHFKGGPGGGDGGGLMDGAIKGLATYHALRVSVFSIASGAELVADHLEKAGRQGETLYKVASAVEHSFHEASKSLHDMIGQSAKNIYNFATGDMSDPAFRDQKADAEASRQLAIRQQEQAAWKATQERRADAAKREREHREDMARGYEELERKREKNLSDRIAKEARWTELKQQLDTRQMGENERKIRHDAELRQVLVNEDLAREAARVDAILEKRKAIQKVNEEGKQLNEQLDAMEQERADALELRRDEAMKGHAGGAGLVLGSREEYQARLKAEQRDDPNRAEDKRHQQRLERLLEKVATLQAELVRLGRVETVVIPGSID